MNVLGHDPSLVTLDEEDQFSRVVRTGHGSIGTDDGFALGIL